MQQITKLCADSLRSFSQNSFGIQLKSSHAHELVAAYFGYSSRAALLADTKCPVSDLGKAEFVVLTPTAFIKERCKDLQGLPENLPHELVDGVYSPLYPGKLILHKVWPTFDYLALSLANERVNATPYFFRDQKVQREGVKVDYYSEGVYLKVSREYVSPSLLLSGLNGKRGVVYIFNLKRVAGHIGYGDVTVSTIEAETLDLALEQIEFPPKPIVKFETIEQSGVSFTDWLRKQENRDSPLGHLATDVIQDKTWPTYTNLDSFRDYLYSKNADWAAIQTLERAWKTYRAFLKRKNSPKSGKPTIKKPVAKIIDRRKITFVKDVTPLHYNKRTVEQFNPGDKAWISWDGRKAIPVTVLEGTERHYSLRVERPPKKAGNKHTLFLDEVRSTPELACLNFVTL